MPNQIEMSLTRAMTRLEDAKEQKKKKSITMGAVTDQYDLNERHDSYKGWSETGC
jgi:hypothetical protein